MTAGAFARGFAGAILDGGVRDVSEIKRDYDFPVFARSVSPGSTVGRFKTLGGNIPVRIGPVEIHPGDIMVADGDGAVCVPRAHAEAVLRMAREIDAREAEQAKLIVQAKSLKEGLAKYGRI
jgi:regulator of RNase E activity RraA